jgi:hypothetical protein
VVVGEQAVPATAATAPDRDATHNAGGRLVFAGDLWHSTGMGNKDARNREKKKPKKKVDKVVQAPPPIVRAPAPKP